MPVDDRSFFQIITAAIADLEEYGYDSQERVDYWMEAIASKLAQTMPSVASSSTRFNERLQAIYARLIDRGAIFKSNPSAISLFTLERIKPALRAELDRRILASSQLIKLNRKKAIETTLQRFAGWATSIPKGGSGGVDRKEAKTTIRKALVQLPFEERRVAIDQGHKLTASINDIVATGSNAIAAEWHSHWRQKGYNYREDHKERDGKIYIIREGWAYQQGLITKGDGFTDEMTKPGEEIFCRCQNRYIFTLRNVPSEFLTDKGAMELKKAKDKVAALIAPGVR